MKRLSVFTLVSAVSLALATNSLAAIVWFPNEDVAIPTTPEGVVIDLLNGTSTVGDDALGADVGFFFGGVGITNDADSLATMPTFQPVRIGTNPLDTVDNLTVGTLVDGGSTFSTGFGGSQDHLSTTFTAGVPGYLGFSLETGSGTVYGWMLVTLEANTAPGTVHEWAYEDSGAGIAVGAIPEPGSSVLALLALGTIALRRRRP